MKKPLLFTIASIIMLTACESSNFDDTKKNKNVEFLQQSSIIERNISKQASEILIALLSNSPNYFTVLNESIQEEKNYLEDRVLFSDLLTNSNHSQNNPLSKTVSSNNFANDFRQYAEKTDNYSRTNNKTEDAINADSLINLLTSNNISIYCPFPLEDYSIDNRIPAICWIETDNLDSLPGVQFYANGTYKEVVVSQEYADKHPVWIIRKEKDYIFNYNTQKNNNLNKGLPTQIRQPHYEAIIENVYCTSYYGPIGEGDLRMYIGTNGNDPKFYKKEGADSIFLTYVTTYEIHTLPRKYVGWAKKGYARGWYYFGQTIDPDWKKDEYEKYIVAYEDDNDNNVSEVSHTIKFEYGPYKLSYNAIIKYNKSQKDDMIGIKEVPRYYFFNVVNNGSDATWTNHENVTSKVDLSGNYLIKCGDLTMSVRSRDYYTSPIIIDKPTEPIKPHPGFNEGTILRPVQP